MAHIIFTKKGQPHGLSAAVLLNSVRFFSLLLALAVFCQSFLNHGGAGFHLGHIVLTQWCQW